MTALEPGMRLKSSMAAMNLQVLCAGVTLFTALLPALRIAALAYDAHRTVLLPGVLGTEALLCVALAVIRINLKNKIWQCWEVKMQASILDGAWNNPA